LTRGIFGNYPTASCVPSATPAQTEVCGYKDLETDSMICQAGCPTDPSAQTPRRACPGEPVRVDAMLDL